MEVVLAGLTIPRLQAVVWRAQQRVKVTPPDPQVHAPSACWQAALGCEQQFRARLLWLGGKQGLRLDGLGADTWQVLVDAGLVRGLLDWINLTPAQLAAVPGIGKARAATLVHTFAVARGRPFVDWLHALGMPSSGQATLPDWATLCARDRTAWQAAGTSAGSATRLVAFFRQAELRAQTSRLHAAGVQGF